MRVKPDPIIISMNEIVKECGAEFHDGVRTIMAGERWISQKD